MGMLENARISLGRARKAGSDPAAIASAEATIAAVEVLENVLQKLDDIDAAVVALQK